VRQLISDLSRDGHQCVADGYVWEEARRNLAVHHPKALEPLHELAREIELHSSFAGAETHDLEVDLPDKDLPVLASAIALHCDALVTGDLTHFGPMMRQTIMGVTVHTPRSLAETVWR
jgi:hypothetical protein